MSEEKNFLVVVVAVTVAVECWFWETLSISIYCNREIRKVKRPSAWW